MNEIIFNGVQTFVPTKNQASELAAQLCSNFGLPSWSEIQTRLNNAKDVAASKSDLVNLLALKYDSKTAEAILERTQSLVDAMDTIADITELATEVEGSIDIEVDIDTSYINQVISSITDFTSVNELISQGETYEKILRISMPNGQNVGITLYYTSAGGNIGYITLSNSSQGSIIMQFKSTDSVTWKCVASNLNNFMYSSNGSLVSFDEVDSSLSDMMGVHEVILHTIDSVPLHGKMASATFLASLADFKSRAAEKVSEYAGKMEFITAKDALHMALSLVSDNSKATHTSGSEYFSPIQNPGYTSNWIVAAGQAVGQVFSTIFAIIFRVVGTVIAVLAVIISKIVDLIVDFSSKVTTGEIDHFASLPIYNYPLTGGTVINSSWFSVYFSPDQNRIIQNALQEKGCCALLPHEDFVIYLILPYEFDNSTGQFSSICVQALSPVSVPSESYEDTCDWAGYGQTPAPVIEGLIVDYTRVNEPTGGKLITYGNQFSDTDYLSMSDNLLVRSAIHSALSLIGAAHVSYIYAKINRSIIIQPDEDPLNSTLHQLLQQIDDIKVYQGHTDITSDLTDGQLSTCKAALIYWHFWYRVKHGADPNIDATWDDAVKLRKITQSFCAQGVAYDFDPQDDLADASELLDPAVEFPSTSRMALLFGAIATAATVAVIAGGTAYAKKVLKRRAVCKVVKRADAAEKAKEAYAADPKNPKLAKQVYKTQKKLGKAWNWAGKMGVQSIDGFDTGATTASPGEMVGTFGRINNSYDDVMAKYQEPNAIGNENTVIRLISGSVTP